MSIGFEIIFTPSGDKPGARESSWCERTRSMLVPRRDAVSVSTTVFRDTESIELFANQDLSFRVGNAQIQFELN